MLVWPFEEVLDDSSAPIQPSNPKCQGEESKAHGSKEGEQVARQCGGRGRSHVAQGESHVVIEEGGSVTVFWKEAAKARTEEKSACLHTGHTQRHRNRNKH
eukprot:3918403-Rhodomonas_salina.2